jgi:hypothetical protein
MLRVFHPLLILLWHQQPIFVVGIESFHLVITTNMWTEWLEDGGGGELCRGWIHRTSFLGLSIAVYPYQVAVISFADIQC